MRACGIPACEPGGTSCSFHCLATCRLRGAQRALPSLQRLEVAPDPKFLNDIIRHVDDLGRAYFFTGEPRYAQRLTEKVRTFFLDGETGMLPSLTYAGMRPGVDKVGRPTVRRRLLACVRRSAGESRPQSVY